MNKKVLKSSVALIALMMLSLVAAACGDPTATVAPAATTAAAGATTAAPAAGATTAAPATGAGTAGKVTGTIKLWHSYGSGGSAEGKALDKAVAQFKTDNPGANVELLDVPFDSLFKKFQTEAATGGNSAPDLFVAPNDSVGDQARAKVIAPLDELVAGKFENFPANVVDGVKVDGKIYGVPQSLKAVAMYYNKKKVANPPKTTDEMLAAAKGGAKFGFQESAYHNFAFWGSFGGKLFDATGKATADQGGFTEALTFLKDMKAAGGQFFTDGDKFGQAFQTGALDAVIEGPWKLADFKKALGPDLGVAVIPAGPKGAAAPLSGVDAYYINASLNKEKQQNAVNFALYMTSPKITKIFVDEAGQVPADKTVQVTDEYQKVFTQAVSTGFPRPQNKELGAYWENFGNAIALVVEKNGDPKQAVTDATAAMNKANGK